jgi:hypothetical protein
MAVTVPGTSGAVTVSLGSGDVLNLAAQIGNLLATIQGAGNLSVTTDSLPGAIPSTATAGVLHGSSGQYVIAGIGGSFSVTDDQSGRDGTQILASDGTLTFTDGVGMFDPTGAAEDIARLYQGLLGRSTDLNGLKFWTSLVDNSHVSLSDIADAIAASPEFVQLYGSLTDEQFIDQIYQNTFGRHVEAGGLQTWEASLAAGTSRGAVAMAIAESAEAKNDSLSTAGDNNNGEIYRLYETAFARAPEFGGLSFWSSVLASGATVQQVADGIAALPEFQTTYGAMTPADFVAAMYQNALGRVPSPAEAQAWVNALNSGTSKASLLVGFADSLESRERTAGATHANWVFAPAPSTTSELVLSGPGGMNTSVPGGYRYIVVNDATPDTLTASNAAIIANDVGGTFFVSGISTVAATGGNNTVNATGTYELSFGAGNNLVIAAGSGTIATGAGHSTVVAANTSGPGNVIDSNGTGDLINAVFGNNTVNAAGSSDTITGGVGNLTVSVTGSNDLVVAGGASLQEFVGVNTAATVIGGSGGSTIFGSSGSNVTFNGSGDLAYSASVGNVTLNAAAASGNVTATMSGGNATIIAGAGAETLNAGAGNNQYLFDIAHTGGATDFIKESAANIATDTFTFSHYSAAPVVGLTGTAVTLTLSDNTKIIFSNLTDPSLLHTVSTP